MSGTSPPRAAPASSPDPTMEDILASIRRILNDDDQAKPAGPAPTPEPLELSSDMIVAKAGAGAAPPPVIAVHAEDPPAAHAAPGAASLAETGTVAAAAASIEQLVRHARPKPTEIRAGGGTTLEDLVREALRPVLKQWLDANLPALVERVVRAEIDRLVARGGP